MVLSESFPIDKNLYGMLTKCQQCPYFSNILKIFPIFVEIECHMCGKVKIQLENSCSSRCKSEELKFICQSFYIF